MKIRNLSLLFSFFAVSALFLSLLYFLRGQVLLLIRGSHSFNKTENSSMRSIGFSKASHPTNEISGGQALKSYEIPRGQALSSEVLDFIEKEEKLWNSPEATAEKAEIESIAAWDSIISDVVKSKESFIARGKLLKNALAQINDESDKNIALQSLFNELPDDQFAVLDEMLLSPQTDEEKETAETIFSNLLNRSDSLKNPYIERISKLRNHPNYVDALHLRTVNGLINK